MTERLRFGPNIRIGRSGFPWTGNPNVAAIWIADSEYITTIDGYVESWDAAQSLNGSGQKVSTYSLAQSTADDRPFYETEGMNGFPSVVSDGVDDWLGLIDSNLVAHVNGTDKPLIEILCYQPISNASGDQIVCWNDGSDGTPEVRFIHASDDYRTDREGDSGTRKTLAGAGGPQRNDDRQVIVARFDGSDGTVERDNLGVIQGPTDLAVGAITAIDRLTIFARRAGSVSSFTECRIRAYAVIINDDTITADRIRQYFIDEQEIA